MSPKILVIRAPGINSDREVAAACQLAGASAERIHVNRLAAGEVRLADFAGVVIPGGFSYGDHLGAGRLLAVDLNHRLREELAALVADGRPVLGICNGFQVLVRAGLLPGGADPASLVDNASGHYECRWVRVAADPASPCVFTRGIEQPFDLPVGHGEGRLVGGPAALQALEQQHLVALRYLDERGQPASSYPANPNGSALSAAGVCNAQGNVFGLMPHPDRAFLPQHHPHWRRLGLAAEGPGMPIFRNMVAHARAI